MSQFGLRGITESLGAPGVEPRPVDTSGSQRLADIQRALGITSQAAIETAQTADLYRHEVERDQHEARMVHEGAAAGAADANWPIIEEDIRTRKLRVPEGVKIEDFVESEISARTEGTPAAYAAMYDKVQRPRLTRALVAQQHEITEDNRIETLRLLKDRASQADTAAGIDETVKEARRLFPDMTEGDAHEAITLEAAKSAAASGDTLRLEEAKKVLGRRFEPEQRRLDAIYADALAENKAKANSAYINDIREQYDSGRTFDSIRERIRGYKGEIDPKLIDQELQEVDQRERQSLRESTDIAGRALLKAARSDMTARMRSAVLSGTSFAVQDGTVVTPDGTTHRIDADAARQEAFRAEFDSIAGQAGLNDEQKFAAQASLAARNGFVPPVWKASLTAGYTAASEQELADPEQMPIATVAGFATFKRLAAQQPGLLEQAVTDRKVYELYDTAAALQQYTSVGGNDRLALFSARRALSTPSALTSMDPRVLEGHADAIVGKFWSADDRNKAEIAGVIKERAYPLIRGGLAPEDAMTRVAEQLKKSTVSVNGYSQVMTGMPEQLKGDINSLAGNIAKRWADKHGKEWGLDADDLTLRPGARTGFWVLSRADYGTPVDGSAEETIFSASDLLDLRKKLDDEKQAKADAATIIRQSTRDIGNPEDEALQRKRDTAETALYGKAAQRAGELRKSLKKPRKSSQ